MAKVPLMQALGLQDISNQSSIPRVPLPAALGIMDISPQQAAIDKANITPQSLSTIGSLGLNPSSIEQDIINLGGGVKTGLAKGIGAVASLPLIRDIPGASYVQRGAQDLANAPAPFANTNSDLYAIGKGVGQYAPAGFFAGEALGTGALGDLLSPAAKAIGAAGIGGYAATPGSEETRLGSAATGALLTGGLFGAGKAIPPIYNAGKGMFGTAKSELGELLPFVKSGGFSAPTPTYTPTPARDLNADTSHFWNTTFNGLDKTSIKNNNAAALKAIYDYHNGIVKNAYNEVNDLIKSRGYNMNVKNSLPESAQIQPEGSPTLQDYMTGDATRIPAAQAQPTPQKILQTFDINPQGEATNLNPLTSEQKGKLLKLSPETQTLFGMLRAGYGGTGELSYLKSPSPFSLAGISDLTDAPTIPKAIEVQTTMNSERNKLYHSGIPANTNVAELLGKAKNSLVADIANTLRANGDNDIANKWLGARDYFAENVAPYGNDNTLYNITEQGKAPSLQKAFTEGDTATKQLLNNHLNNTPNSVTANGSPVAATRQLRQGLMAENIASKVSGEQGSKQLTLDNLVKAYNSAPDIIKSLTPPEIPKEINSFYQQGVAQKAAQADAEQKFQNTLQAFKDNKKRMLKLGGKYLAIGGALAAPIIGKQLLGGAKFLGEHLL